MAEETKNLILLSKLQAPQLKTKTLLRERLLNLLSANLDKKIILLYAGAGYGKTTLLSQFLTDVNIFYVYYHLEKSDALPAVFLAYLIEGIRKFKPEFGKKTKKLNHLFNYPERFLNIVIGTFINEIIENITEDLYIILEDYHLLEPSKPIDSILIYLLEHLPPRLHFIITSRVIPNMPLSQFRARSELFELDTTHLRFTRDEIQKLFEMVYAISLKESEIEWLAEHSEGWPTSLRLMLQVFDYLEDIKPSDYLRRLQDNYYRIQSNIFNYFAQEIYDRESSGIQQFMVDCSLLEWLSPQICEAVTGRKDSSEILSNFTASNAFVFGIPGLGYRFHSLFRDFLQNKITDDQRRKKIYLRAANHYRHENKLEEAAKFYLSAEEHITAGIIIEKIGSPMISQGKSAVLGCYLEQLPKSIRDKSPVLLTHYSQSLIYAGRSDEAKHICIRAARMLKKDKFKYADALYKLAGIYLNQGNFRLAEKWFAKALKSCKKGSNLIKASILNSLGSIYNTIGGRNLQIARRYFKKALPIAQTNKFKELEASILNNWAMNEWKMGNLNKAYECLSKMVNLLKEYFSPGCGAGFYNAARGSLLLGYKEEARSILDLGNKICQTYNDLWSTATIWKGYALLYQELTDLKMAKEFINKSLEVYEKLGVPWLVITALTEMCKINISEGNLSDAEKNLKSVWDLKKNRDDAEATPILLTEAKFKFAQDKFGDAQAILLKALNLAKKFKQIFEEFLVYIELSKIYHQLMKTERLISTLKEAIKITRKKGYDYLFLKELNKEVWMLPIIKSENLERDYIFSLIKVSKSGTHFIDATFFGVPQISIDGKKITDNIWKTTKAKKLFFYLLLHKNELINQDTIIEAFWQKAGYKSAQDSLRKAIQHIREVFKSHGLKEPHFITSGRGSYQITSQMSVTLDIEEFQNIISEAKNLKVEDEKLRTHLPKALSLYQQGFAFGWYDNWILDMRHYYESLYEECLRMMADFYFRKNRFKETVNWHKKLIALDFYNEEYHRKLMMVYAKLKRYKDIKETFEKLKKILKEELNSEPQEETIALYKSLLK